MSKIFKKIPDFEEYEINEDGTEVLKNGQKLSIFLNGSPYPRKYVSIAGTKKQINRLVAITFINNPDPVLMRKVLHKDGNIHNNHYTNLYWSNNSEKMREQSLKFYKYVRDNGIVIKYKKKPCIYSDLDIKRMYNLYCKGVKVINIAKEYNCHPKTVLRYVKKYHLNNNE